MKSGSRNCHGAKVLVNTIENKTTKIAGLCMPSCVVVIYATESYIRRFNFSPVKIRQPSRNLISFNGFLRMSYGVLIDENCLAH